MKMWRILLGVCGSCLLAASIASPQAPARAAGPAPAQVRDGGRGPQTVAEMNRKILPTTMTWEQILPLMQTIRDGLGVTCEYCHEYYGPFNPKNDFANDAKEAKENARVMMRTVQTINQTFSAEIPRLDKPAAGAGAAATRQTVQVQCVTCHRGVPIPKPLIDIVLETGNARGPAAAVAQYRDLRRAFYGASAYDFTDVTLFTAAQRSNAARKPDDAIAYAQLNVEFNPMSARSYQVMSQAYAQKNDTANAIAALEKAIAIDPMNQGFQNQLNQLKNPGRGGRGN
jgi:tetratricopeptide (TPR) repeat protein